MPNGAFIPSWLKAADPAAEYGRGYGLGLEAAAQRASQQLQAQNLALQQQRAAQEAQAAAQRQAVSQAEWQSEFGLAQQEQEQKAQAAAAKFSAMQEYEAAVRGGMDAGEAILRYGPRMGAQGTPEAAVLRAQLEKKKPIPTYREETSPSGAKYMYSPETGAMHVLPRTHPALKPGPVEAQRVLDAETGEEIEGFIAVPSPTGEGMTVRTTKPPAELSPSAAASMLSKMPEFMFLDPSITNEIPALKARAFSGLAKATAKTDDFSAYPPNPKDRKIGQTYRTPKGLFTWTASGWIPYAE